MKRYNLYYVLIKAKSSKDQLKPEPDIESLPMRMSIGKAKRACEFLILIMRRALNSLFFMSLSLLRTEIESPKREGELTGISYSQG